MSLQVASSSGQRSGGRSQSGPGPRPGGGRGSGEVSSGSAAGSAAGAAGAPRGAVEALSLPRSAFSSQAVQATRQRAKAQRMLSTYDTCSGCEVPHMENFSRRCTYLDLMTSVGRTGLFAVAILASAGSSVGCTKGRTPPPERPARGEALLIGPARPARLGELASPQLTSVDGWPSSLVAGDVDNDGLTDLIVISLVSDDGRQSNLLATWLADGK